MNTSPIIIIKFIFAHIQNNWRHYAMVSILCSMLRSLRVPSGVPRCWSRPLGPHVNNAARAQSLQKWPSSCQEHHAARQWRPINLSLSNQISSENHLPVHACVHVRDLKKQGYLNIAESNVATWFRRTIYTNMLGSAWTSNRAKMGSLSPVMSTGVTLLEAVMPTGHSQGGWEDSHICLPSTTYMESSINNLPMLNIYTSKFQRNCQALFH